MKQLTCEMCGSNDLLKQDGVFVCQSCGCKYSVEEAKKLLVEIEGTVEVKGTVAVDKTKETEALLKRAFMLLEDGEWRSAKEYFEKVLDIDPENGRAYLGQLMVDLKVTKQDDIQTCYEDFSQNNSYQKAYRFADDALKYTLSKYVEYFNKKTAPLINQLQGFELGTESNYGLEIKKIKDNSITSVNIPYGVTSIGINAFSKCPSLQSVTIPNSVKVIASGAFYDCPNLTSVIIPGSVTSIGSYAFKSCKNLQNVTISNGVKRICNEAFWGCNSLTQIDIPDSVTEIDRDAFRVCSNLAHVKIGKGVTTIASEVFCGCSNLASITIPTNVKKIEFKAFAYTGLQRVYVSPSTEIDKFAFYNCDRVSVYAHETSNPVTNTSTSVAAKTEEVKTQYDNALYRGKDGNPYFKLVAAISTDITSCTIHGDTKIIASAAFENCKNLQSIHIPSSVTQIGTKAFEGCRSLESVHIKDLSAWCNISFDIFANPLCHAHALYLDGKLITDLVIPDGVKKIGSYAFEDCYRLEGITLPNSLTTIGFSAFFGCRNLKSVEISNNVEDIEMCAFSYCVNLTSVTISDSVKNLHKSAFDNCHKKLTIMLKTQDGKCKDLPLKKYFKKYAP